MPTSGGGVSDPIPGSGSGGAGPIVPRDVPRTSLSLERFARVLNYSPLLIHGVYVPDLHDALACSDPILQYSWQQFGGGQPGRTEILHSIQQAEQVMESVAGFPLKPRWVVDEELSVARAAPGRWLRPSSYKVRGRHKYGMYGGREAWSIIDEDAVVAYSDRDGDGYAEYATVTVNTAVTDPNEIEVYYPDTDHDQGWEVRPINVSISGGVATITFGKHLVVLPDLLERFDARGVDGTTNNNFLSLVDVWRHYNDPSQMGIVEWQPGYCSDVAAGDVAAQSGYITPTDRRNSLFDMRPANWDANAGAWSYACQYWGCGGEYPHNVRLWYRAGYRDMSLSRPNQEMSPDLERAVTYLAVAYLDREWTTCEQLRNVMDTWRADRALSGGGSRFQLSRGALENPFGTSKGAQYAYEVIKRLQVGEAVLND